MKKYLIMFFVAAAAVFQSCNNNDDLWDAIDDLKSRVQALETQVDALNGNIEAIQALANNGTISSVKEENGKCIITMTNGKVLTLVNDISAQMPIVSIVDGVWHCTVNGKTTSLEVKAVAEDGVTPQFRVDEATGHWQVNTTGKTDGTGWVDVTYEDGETPVSAIADNPQSDTFFESVKVNGDNLEIVLKGSDSTLSIPIVKDFLCQIVDSEGTPIEGVQTFPAGVEKSYQVNMRGVVSTIVSAPEGWTAVLSDPTDGENGLQTATLTVTSPESSGASAATRATASTAKDVSILASSGQFSCIAKIQVESTGQAPVPPTAQVAFTEATTESLTFTVTLSEDTESWKYICRASTEEAPSVEDFETLGTVGTDLIVTIPDLAGKTAYKLYVVAYANGLNSTVAEAEGTTKDPDADPNDYWTNGGVEIEGITYDQNSPGAERVEISAEATENRTIPAREGQNVFFIGRNNSGGSYNYVMAPKTSIGVPGDNIYIGRYIGEKPTVKINNVLAMRNAAGIVAFKNLVLDFEDTATTGNYLINFNGGTDPGVGTLVFEDCEIIYNKESLMSAYNAAGSIGNIIFRNCKIRYTGTSAGFIFNLSSLGGKFSLDLTKLKSIVVENCIVYSTNCSNTNCAFLSANSLDLNNLTLTVENNTFVDFRGSGTTLKNAGTFVLYKFGSIFCKSNIFYSTIATGYPAVFALTNDYADAWPTIDMMSTGNIAYGAVSWKMFSQAQDKEKNPIAFNPSSYTSVVIPKANSPFTTCEPETGTFVVSSDFTGYGSSLE